MAKEMVYFNATKQIETITIHYNSKLDGTFVDDVTKHIKEISKKMSKVDLKNPKEFEDIQVFVYPTKKLFYSVFSGEIEKRFYARRRSLEDLYVVQDAEGNIHIVSPRSMATEKIEAFKKILVMKVLGEYMEDKEKQTAEKLLKQALKPKEEEKEELEEEKQEQQTEEVEEIEEEDIEQEELEELIETELIVEQIDEEKEQAQKENVRTKEQEWLSFGWFAYVKGKLKKEKDIKQFASNISKNGVKKLGQLSDSKLFENYDFSKEYACAIVEYIVKTYGAKKFTEFYENPKDIKGVFGVPKFVFDSQLKAYIKEKYVNEPKTLNVIEDMNMEKDFYDIEVEKEIQSPINEITEIHFVKSGGVDITSDKEIEAPEIQIKE